MQMHLPIRLNDAVRHFGTRGLGFSARENIVIKTVKALHLLSATAWAGGAISMQALSYLRLSGTLDEETARVVGMCLHFIDGVVVMPGLAGCIITGVFYSTCTSIHFFRYLWVGYKWIVSLCAGFWGTMFWSPAGDSLIAWCVTRDYGMEAALLRFIRSCMLPESFWQAALQTSIIFSMLIISVYRPRSWHHLRRLMRHAGAHFEDPELDDAKPDGGRSGS